MYGIIDTSSMFLTLPSQLYYFVISNMEMYLSTFDYGYFECSEKKNAPTIDILYDGYWFEIIPDDYI